MGGGKAKVPSLGGMDISGTTPYKVSYFQRKATLARPVQRKPSLLLSPRPLGRPDTQASTKVTRHLWYVNYFISFPRGPLVAEVRFILCCLLVLHL